MNSKPQLNLYDAKDCFYDVVIDENLFLITQYFPKQNCVIVSYLDEQKILKGANELQMVRQKIQETYAEIEGLIVRFENLQKPKTVTDDKGEIEGTLITFIKRYRMATKENFLNAEVQSMNGYYPVKDTDHNFHPNDFGRMFNYGSKDYALTVLAYFCNRLSINLLNQTIQENGELVSNDLLRSKFESGLIDMNDLALPTTKEMKQFSNELTKLDYMPSKLWQTDADIIRKGWLLTNRFIDVARLNEKQSRTPLKRLVAQLGLNINANTIFVGTSLENINDVANVILASIENNLHTLTLFQHPVYQSNYKIKMNLLKNYPVTIYEPKEGSSIEANVQPNSVKADRLTVDSTSSKLVSAIIAPYKKLTDKPAVSLMYPSEKVANELGIEPFDVLEDSMAWAIENIPNGQQAFQPIYDFYSAIRGCNVNDELVNDYQKINLKAHQLQHNTNWFYRLNEVDPQTNEAKMSSCMVSFSVGGIHGQEINMDVLESTLQKHESINNVIHQLNSMNQEQIALIYRENPTVNIFTNKEIRKLILADVTYKEAPMAIRTFINSDADIRNPASVQWLKLDEPSEELPYEEYRVQKAFYDKLQELAYESAYEKYRENGTVLVLQRVEQAERYQIELLPHAFEYKDVSVASFVKKVAEQYIVTPLLTTNIEEILFTKDKTGYKLRKEFRFVSDSSVQHQDFKSYYATLMSRLSTFDTDAYHPYQDIIQNKLNAERSIEVAIEQGNISILEELNLERESYKLLLNAASGEADTKNASNIRKNNEILSMRIIGQLLSWRIGQALTLHGAKVVSTNTDGLYTSNISEELNRSVLEQVLKSLHIDIEPETIDRFISKDSNNRLEIQSGDIVEAKGSDLSSYQGASVTRNTSLPTVIDTVVAKYLAEQPNASNEAFDEEYARTLFERILAENDESTILHMFQWIVNGNPKLERYPYTYKVQRLGSSWHIVEGSEKLLQQTNRVYLVKSGSTSDVIALATLKYKKQPQSQSSRAVESLLKNAGYPVETRGQQEVSSLKIDRMPENQSVMIDNQSVFHTNKAQQIIKSLDINSYLELVRQRIEKSWLNHS